jgi:hypothetical protein
MAVILKKNFTKMSYHVRRCMAFKANELGHDLNHDIICPNELILCTRMYLGMENNVDKGSFHSLCRKINFLFSTCEN